MSALAPCRMSDAGGPTPAQAFKPFEEHCATSSSAVSAAPSHDRPWKSLLLQNGGALILRLPCQPPSSRPPSPSPCTQARHPAMAGALRALRSRHLLHRMCAACADPSTSYALVPILSPFPALLPFWPNSLNTHTISLRLEG
jgi:hypothetical protein